MTEASHCLHRHACTTYTVELDMSIAYSSPALTLLLSSGASCRKAWTERDRDDASVSTLLFSRTTRNTFIESPDSSMWAILSAFLPGQRLRAAPREFHEGKVCPHRFRPLARSFRAQLRITAVAIEDPGLTAVTQTDVEDLPQPLFETGGGYRRHHFHTPGEIAEHPVGRANVKFPIERIFVASGEMEDP